MNAAKKAPTASGQQKCQFKHLTEKVKKTLTDNNFGTSDQNQSTSDTFTVKSNKKHPKDDEADIILSAEEFASICGSRTINSIHETFDLEVKLGEGTYGVVSCRK